MAQVASLTTQKLHSYLTAPAGLTAALAQITDGMTIELPALGPAQVIAQNVALEIAEKSTVVRYPVVHVYCEKAVNSQREKFRTFSGTAQMVAEVRASQDQLSGLQQGLELYVDAVTQVLDGARGDWGDGVFYAGGYQIEYGPVKKGGRSQLQTAKVSFTVEISKN